MSEKKTHGGARPGAGRPKGAKDKISRNLREMILDTAEQLAASGKSLEAEAEADPKWFYMNFLKPMLPKDVIMKGDEDNPIVNEVKIRFIRPE